MIGAAVLVGASAQSAGHGVTAFRALRIGMVVAGIAGSLIGIVQVSAPQWPDGDLVARTYITGRAVGNMRQPNHLSSLFVWAMIAAVWLAEIGVLRRWVGGALTPLFVIVLSASRTGTGSVILLAPVAYDVFWLGTSARAEVQPLRVRRRDVLFAVRWPSFRPVPWAWRRARQGWQKKSHHWR